jgi:hypothetical protein
MPSLIIKGYVFEPFNFCNFIKSGIAPFFSLPELLEEYLFSAAEIPSPLEVYTKENTGLLGT